MKEGAQELYSSRQNVGGRTYFFDVNRGSSGDLHLSLSESRKKDGGFERHRIIVFEEDVAKFVDELLKAVSAMGEAHSAGAVRPAEPPLRQQARYAEIRKKHPRAYSPWRPDEDAQLTREIAEKKSVAEIAKLHQRQPNAIRSRIVRLQESRVAETK